MARHDPQDHRFLHPGPETRDLGQRPGVPSVLFASPRFTGRVRGFPQDPDPRPAQPDPQAAPGTLSPESPKVPPRLVRVHGHTEDPQRLILRPPTGTSDHASTSPFVRILTGLITFYQKAISPSLPTTCRYYPTCSEYTKQAVVKYGPFKGLFKGLLRILRCNPLFPGGYDPV